MSAGAGDGSRSALRAARRRWLIQAGALASSFVLPPWFQRAVAQSQSTLNVLPRVALVIGNTKYIEAPLKNPGNDAKGIAGELQKLGFQVNLKLDAGRSEMIEAIRAFGTELGKKKGIGMFYYAGHGAQLAWKNYLIPVDAVIDRVEDMHAKTIELNLLLDGLIKAHNPMNVIILDACRDNPFGNKVRSQQKGLAQFDAPPGSLLAYATSPGNTARDGEGENGLYTENLLRELKVPGAKIEDVFKRVRLNVRRKSEGQQIPWESTSLEEDFYFLPPAQVRKLTAEEAEKLFEEQLGTWERVKASKDPAPLEDYIRKYPSGNFSELAQFRLDKLLAEKEAKLAEARRVSEAIKLSEEMRQTEENLVEARRTSERKKLAEEMQRAEEKLLAQKNMVSQSIVESVQPIQVVSIAANPYSRGTAKADTAFRIGDSYSYRSIDTLTQLETRQFTNRVTGLTDFEVIFNDGRTITDSLGNLTKSARDNRLSGRQFFVPEYSVGKKWTTRYRFTTAKGVKNEVEVNFKVMAKETIKVPAGTFEAFKVEGEGYNIFRGSHLRYVYWIAPDQVRQPIVFESVEHNRYGRLFTTNRTELVAYNQDK